MNMAKAIVGSTAMIFIISAPAHAQMGSSSNISWGQGGGGGVGGSAPAAINVLPHTAPANPGATIVSGSDADYRPSNFVSFDQAIADGKQRIIVESRTVAQAAAESRRTPQPQAKLIVAQDNRGKIMLTAR